MVEVMPFPFYLSCLLLLCFIVRAWLRRYEAWGIPALAVYGTAMAWYIGDVFYNDYTEYFLRFGSVVLGDAWWQVCLFVGAFGLLVERVHRVVNGRFGSGQSRIIRIVEHRELYGERPQQQINNLALAMFGAWALLMFVALIRVDFDFVGLFLPYLGERANPWSRSRTGAGVDALLSLAGYFQIFLVAAFGVILGVSRNPITRMLAVVVCLFALPYYLFGRARNAILATAMPGFLCWVFVRFQGHPLKKIAVLAGAAIVTNFWFAFILSSRTETSVADSFAQGVDFAEVHEVKHLGLNMFEELCFINSFISSGIYEPNWGERYLSEAVNPIPRSLWPGKPMVGIDYAIVRGKGGGAALDAGVTATISTGMIGQGVVNFGCIGGPIAASLLMCLWVAMLARQDLKCYQPGRLFVYVSGLILTFNLGRDVTLLVLYPFVFGWTAVACWEYRQRANAASEAASGMHRENSGTVSWELK